MTRIRTSHIVVAAVAALVAVGGSASVALAGPPPPHCTVCSTGGGGGGGSTSTGGGGGSTTTTTRGGGGGDRRRRSAIPSPPPRPRDRHRHSPSRDHRELARCPKSQIISGVVVRRGLAANCPTTTSDGVGIGGSAEAIEPGGQECQGRRNVLLLGLHDHAVPQLRRRASQGRRRATGEGDRRRLRRTGQQRSWSRWNAAAGATGYRGHRRDAAPLARPSTAGRSRSPAGQDGG